MFRQLAQSFTPQERILEVPPEQLSRWLEQAWASASQIPPIPGFGPATPDLDNPGIVVALGAPSATAAFPALPVALGPLPGVTLTWHHLMYAYIIENTGAYEVFWEVLRRLISGDTLGRLNTASQQWARTTEELFFRDPPHFSTNTPWSFLRPDYRVARRNAYWRMFGMDLSHPLPGAPGEQPWKQNIGGVNLTFRQSWSEFLRQVWLGFENRGNSSGPNATDSGFVAQVAQSLADMLRLRRLNGVLAREEFSAVVTMSWFHLTLSTNTSILIDLGCTAGTPADRLAKVAQRVGMTSAPRSRELFDLAERVSTILRGIEIGLFSTPSGASALFSNVNTLLRDEMNNIVDLWQSATGERLKERPTGTVLGGPPAPAQPIRVPSTEPLRPSVPAGVNGSRG